jgi:hypothetical protein
MPFPTAAMARNQSSKPDRVEGDEEVGRPFMQTQSLREQTIEPGDEFFREMQRLESQNHNRITSGRSEPKAIGPRDRGNEDGDDQSDPERNSPDDFAR